MNISFTQQQEAYIASLVESGEFQNSSEVVRDALRLHKLYQHKIKLEELRAAIDLGWEGKTSNRSVRDIIRDKTKKKAM